MAEQWTRQGLPYYDCYVASLPYVSITALSQIKNTDNNYHNAVFLELYFRELQ